MGAMLSKLVTWVFDVVLKVLNRTKALFLRNPGSTDALLSPEENHDASENLTYADVVADTEKHHEEGEIDGTQSSVSTAAEDEEALDRLKGFNDASNEYAKPVIDEEHVPDPQPLSSVSVQPVRQGSTADFVPDPLSEENADTADFEVPAEAPSEPDQDDVADAVPEVEAPSSAQNNPGAGENLTYADVVADTEQHHEEDETDGTQSSVSTAVQYDEASDLLKFGSDDASKKDAEPVSDEDLVPKPLSEINADTADFEILAASEPDHDDAADALLGAEAPSSTQKDLDAGENLTYADVVDDTQQHHEKEKTVQNASCVSTIAEDDEAFDRLKVGSDDASQEDAKLIIDEEPVPDLLSEEYVDTVDSEASTVKPTFAEILAKSATNVEPPPPEEAHNASNDESVAISNNEDEFFGKNGDSKENYQGKEGITSAGDHAGGMVHLEGS